MRGEGWGEGLCGAKTNQLLDAQGLRRALTKQEFLLWRRLRNRQLEGFKFVRQEPIGPYYADFACRERKLIVEVDGSQHLESATDRRRDKLLAKLGYRTVRVWNNEVLNNIDGVLEMLLEELRKQPLTRRASRATLSP
jgi:very-short-patch-repair endonuclease